MKKQTSLVTLSLLLATPALAGGAGAPAVKPATAAGPCRSIAQILAADPQFSTLLTAVQAAGLEESLTTGSYTVFAPTNAAFAKVPSDQLAMVLNDADMLSNVLLYHVMTGQMTAKQVMSVKSAKTVQGANVSVQTMGSRVMINGANVVKADVAACNGVIHVIDAVLMPPMSAPAAQAPAAEPAAAAPATTETMTTETATTETATTEAATTETPAPAPAAAAAFDISRIPALPLSGATYTGTATTTATTTETATTETATTETATTETATAETATTETATAETATAETGTEVAAESNTLYDVLVNDDRFSTLRDLISDAGLTETLTGGEFTIFAPTNEAFDALPEGTLAILSANPDALRAILTYHVVAGRLSAAQLSTAATPLTSVQGGTITLTENGTRIGDATIAVNDAITGASNGNIYALDRVLMPPGFTLPAAQVVEAAPADASVPGSLAALLETDARFSTLAGLVKQAGLVDTLSNGNYTLFAPTNDAFTKIAAADLTALGNDAAKLRQVLLGHVIPSRITETALASSTELTNANNAKLTLQKMTGPDRTMIGNATITAGAPLAANNGVVYVIDTVLMP